MKAITFLGGGKYEAAIYQHDGGMFPTSHFVEAFCHFFPPTELLILATEYAEQQNWAHLEPLLQKANIRHRKIRIPNGYSEAEMWEIFDVLTEEIQEGEQVIFDVTHAFRSLPMLALIAVSYLRVAKSVKIEGIYYGCYEGRQPTLLADGSTQAVAPIINMTPFVTLMDWAAAADTFIKTGDSRDLAAELRGSLHNLGSRSAEQEQLPQILEQVSLASVMTQPEEITQKTHDMEQSLAYAEQNADSVPRPFRVLLSKVQRSYMPIAANASASRKAQLLAQWNLFERYVQRKQYFQAYPMAREWMVSVACLCIADPNLNWRNHERRAEVAKALDTVLRAKIDTAKNPYGEPLQQNLKRQNLNWQARRKLLDAWWAVGKLRNAAAHCGYAPDHSSSAVFEQKMDEVYKQLKSDVLPLVRRFRG